MKKKTVLFLSMAIAASMFTGCTEKVSDDNEPSANVVSDNEPTEEGSVPVETNAADGGFEVKQITTEESYQYDIDGDGQPDAFSLEEKEIGEYDTCRSTLNVGDAKLEILTEENSNDYQYADVFFVHRNDSNYVIASLEGDTCMWTTELYKWDNGEFTFVDDITGFDIDDASAIKEDKVVFESYCDAFGTFSCTKDVAYGDEGFSSEDDTLTISDTRALKLKKDVTLRDESGKECGTAKAGESICPITLNDDVVGFEDEKGKFLGYLEFEIKDDDEHGSAHYVDGVSEYDLFEEVMYAG
jgi:hypothetical protein